MNPCYALIGRMIANMVPHRNVESFVKLYQLAVDPPFLEPLVEEILPQKQEIPLIHVPLLPLLNNQTPLMLVGLVDSPESLLDFTLSYSFYLSNKVVDEKLSQIVKFVGSNLWILHYKLFSPDGDCGKHFLRGLFDSVHVGIVLLEV